MNEPIYSVKVDPRRCEGHGICIELANQFFDLGGEDTASVTDEQQALAHPADVRAAAAACPRQAIIVA